MRERLEIEFVCSNLPGDIWNGRQGVRLGVQAGERVEQDVSADENGALFRLFVVVREGKEPGTLDFGGEFVKGTANERFVYLSWGVRHGAAWETLGRTKVPLTCIGAERARRAIAEGNPLRAALSLSDSRGRRRTALRGDGEAVWE